MLKCPIINWLKLEISGFSQFIIGDSFCYILTFIVLTKICSVVYSFFDSRLIKSYNILSEILTGANFVQRGAEEGGLQVKLLHILYLCFVINWFCATDFSSKIVSLQEYWMCFTHFICILRSVLVLYARSRFCAENLRMILHVESCHK